jgi:predicted negative regulator of RcsB-dependent stress response
MANQLDLEEQEQLDQLKHFWAQYGNLITWVLIAVLSAFAAWNAYQYWQRNQATQAAALFDELERVAKGNDTAKLDRVLGDMKDKFASTTYAQQAALLAAKVYFEAGKSDEAKSTLSWVADKSSDTGYQAIARLRMAGILLESKAYDEALKQLANTFPPDFAALVADRRGDVYLAQGKKTEAGAEFLQAYQSLDEGSEYRRLVEVKMAALGLSVPTAKAESLGEKK